MKITRPLFFYCKKDVTDYPWIMSRMKVIPEEFRKGVSNKYENIYLRGGGRGAANEYLNEVATKYRKVKPEVKRTIEPKVKAQIAEVKTGGKREFKSECGLWSKKI